MKKPRLRIRFKDRVGFVFDISRVIFTWRLNIVSIEIQLDSLYIYLEESNDLAGLLKELREITGVLDICHVPLMPSEEREKELKIILDSVSEGILAVDLDGRITTINPVCEKIFQRSAVELIGKRYAEVFSAEAPILRCLTEGKSYNYTENSLNTPKGRLNFLSTGRPLKDDNGNIIGAVACIKDMSEVKQLVYSLTKPSMTTFDEILGTSDSLNKAKEMARMVAKGDSTVLIRGESGTGKELFARAIHMESYRQGKPFVPINCAALPDNLLESELFGYVEGAFTGAQKGGKVGLFEFANNGTLFLDEIGELSTHLQAKLLRVLQEGRVRRIGDRVENPINVRVIAATNRNLEEMIKKGDFREDLYYRLNVVPIHIPSLKKRKEDIPILTNYLITKFNSRLKKNVKSMAEKSMEKLINYPWPGNIREMENVIERAMILVSGTEIQPEHIILDRYNDGSEDREHLQGYTKGVSGTNNIYDIDIQKEIPDDLTLDKAVDEFERRLIVKALAKHKTIRQTAKVLGVSHTTIMNKIKKFEL